MAFDSQVDNHTIRVDADGLMGYDSGPEPIKLLLVSLTGCTGMDVVSLLTKMGITTEGFEIDIEADLTEDHPKTYSEIRLVYRFYGLHLNKVGIEKAVQLSQEKYCCVTAMLKKVCPVKYSITFEEKKSI